MVCRIRETQRWTSTQRAKFSLSIDIRLFNSNIKEGEITFQFNRTTFVHRNSPFRRLCTVCDENFCSSRERNILLQRKDKITFQHDTSISSCTQEFHFITIKIFNIERIVLRLKTIKESTFNSSLYPFLSPHLVKSGIINKNFCTYRYPLSHPSRDERYPLRCIPLHNPAKHLKLQLQ